MGKLTWSCMKSAVLPWDHAHKVAPGALEQHKLSPTALARQKWSSLRPAADWGGKTHKRGSLGRLGLVLSSLACFCLTSSISEGMGIQSLSQCLLWKAPAARLAPDHPAERRTELSGHTRAGQGLCWGACSRPGFAAGWLGVIKEKGSNVLLVKNKQSRQKEGKNLLVF